MHDPHKSLGHAFTAMKDAGILRKALPDHEGFTLYIALSKVISESNTRSP